MSFNINLKDVNFEIDWCKQEQSDQVESQDVDYIIKSYNSCTPYNRLSGQHMLSGTQIISTSHGMTGRNFFEVFLPFYLLFGF